MRNNATSDEIRKPAEECRNAPELMSPAPECLLAPPENVSPPPEFDRTSGGGYRAYGSTTRGIGRKNREEEYLRQQTASEGETRRESRVQRQLLRTMLTPAAAVIVTVAVLFASIQYDPLGNDFLMAGARTESALDDIKGETGKKQDKPPAATPTPKATPTPAATPTPMPKLISGAEGSVSFAEPLTWKMYHVEGANGESYESPLSETSEEDVNTWLDTWGGSHDLDVTSTEKVFLGYMFSDDAIPVGDMDYLPGIYLAQGTMYAVYREDIYCKAYLNSITPTGAVTGDDLWPTMPNLAPDLTGANAATGESEQYVRFAVNGESNYRYLVIGDAWIGMGGSLSDVPGASYDASTNTLTLTDCTADVLDVNLMGNGFTVNLVGDSHIGTIFMWGFHYGGSVTFKGTGTLTLNENRLNSYGILMNSEWSPTALFVDSGIDIHIYGADGAILISGTSMETAIYYRKKTLLSGGTCTNGQFERYARTVTDENGYVVFDENGNPLQEELTLDQIAEMFGERYYDYTVVDDSGSPSKEVHFTDPNR